MIPHCAAHWPIQPFVEYKVAKAIPATAVGKAKGRSIKASAGSDAAKSEAPPKDDKSKDAPPKSGDKPKSDDKESPKKPKLPKLPKFP